MKGIKLLLAVCLALHIFGGATADEDVDTARAARRVGGTTATTSDSANRTLRGTVNTTSNRQNTAQRTTPTTSTNTVQSRDSATNVVSRETDSARSNTSTTGTARTTGVTSRNSANVISRTTTNRDTATQRSGTVISRTTNTPNRATSVSRTTSTPRTTSVARIMAAPRTAISSARPQSRNARSATTVRGGAQSSARVSRAATMNNVVDVMTNTYTQCRQVYNSCMDEFCANKDSQLKRCACSSRINEFDKYKESLTNIDDKLLDFNQRLLTVNMDAEDAAALSVATEGELAFTQKDTSESKQMLDDIAKKLDSAFDNEDLNRGLSAISLSLDMDAAFDTVDSLAGASTTVKSGVALYNAALPVCREMALEVCTEDELDIAESGYQMQIEQDCNTVSKAYATQSDQARERVREGSALLDMARLDIYQKRNSDDILTCKKKMLDMLTNTTVCGADLSKCLDTTGQYIDPSTGEAFLTVNLVNLGQLLTRPTADKSWTEIPANGPFITFLESKKKFLEPAMENCQDISDYVWDEFIEDALAQIKLAQDAKLEEMRQSCTTLTTQCMDNAYDSLAEFDARALSTFGVTADRTVNAMCSDISLACTALMEMHTDDTGDTTTDDTWIGGMTQIATMKTYDTIIKTCREVGRTCFIQTCKAISGSFGLCEDIQTSVSRRAILNRESCWQEVLQCVAEAGADAINSIFTIENGPLIDTSKGRNTFYELVYGTADQCISNGNSTCTPESSPLYDICYAECTTQDSLACRTCRLAEQLWGHCEYEPSTVLSSSEDHNQIRIPDGDKETLLSWLAKNTNTDTVSDSCRVTLCPFGEIAYTDNSGAVTCVSITEYTSDGLYCPSSYWRTQIGTEKSQTNCCRTIDTNNPIDGTGGTRDTFGNCCLNGTARTTKINGMKWDTTQEYYYHEDNEITTEFIGTESISGDELTQLKQQLNYLVEDNDAITPQGLCLPGAEGTPANFVAAFPSSNTGFYNSGVANDIWFLICMGEISDAEDVPDSEANAGYPSGQTIKCNGEYVLVSQKTGKTINPTTMNAQQPTLYRETSNSAVTTNADLPNKYNMVYDGTDTEHGNWEWKDTDGAIGPLIPTRHIIQYESDAATTVKMSL